MFLFIILEAGAQEKKIGKKEKEKTLRSKISELREKNSLKKKDPSSPFQIDLNPFFPLDKSRGINQKNRDIRLTVEETSNRDIRLTVEEITFDVSDFDSKAYNRGYVLKSTSGNGVLVKGVEQGVVWHFFVKVEGKVANYLQVRKRNAGAFFPVFSNPSGYGTEVARGIGTGLPLSFGLDYRWILNWAKNSPGKYNINLIYSVVVEMPSENGE